MQCARSGLRLVNVSAQASWSALHAQRSEIPRHVALLRRFYADYPPHIKINMPALSPTMTAGNIGKWAKKIGDNISAGDVLVEIETDKATMDFECQEEGYLAKIVIPGGSKDIPVNKLIAILAEKKEDVAKFADFAGDADAAAPAAAPAKKEEAPKAAAPVPAAAPAAPAAPAAAAPAAAAEEAGFIIASPAAKKLALEKGAPLGKITGTGPNGRIVLADVEKYLASAPAAAPAAAAAAPKAPTPAPAPVSSTSAAFTDIPLSNIRKIIASRLTESKQTIPHFYLTVELNVDKLLELRADLNKKSDVKISINDFIIKAASKALLKVPEVNSSWQNDFIRQYHSADVSVAVATPRGLITPIVFSAEQKGLAEISKSVKELSERAKEGKLGAHEYQGGSFSISNLGMFGVKSFTAIINPPQSCILAVGAVNKAIVPAESESGYKTSNVLNVTLSCDHRVVDGAVGAQWLQSLKGFVEDPVTLLL